MPPIICFCVCLVMLVLLADRMTDRVVRGNAEHRRQFNLEKQASQTEDADTDEIVAEDGASKMDEAEQLRIPVALVGGEQRNAGAGLDDPDGRSSDELDDGHGKPLLSHLLDTAEPPPPPKHPKFKKKVNFVEYRDDGHGHRLKITHCVEYLKDHVHCKPIIDMDRVYAVQDEWGMSDDMLRRTVEAEKNQWKDSWSQGLTTDWLILRIVETAHNAGLKKKVAKRDYSELSDAEKREHRKHELRRAFYSHHPDALKTTTEKHLDDKRKREIVAAKAVIALRHFYISVHQPKHNNYIDGLVYRYIDRGDMLDLLIERLETKYGRDKVAPYLYRVRAARDQLLVTPLDKYIDPDTIRDAYKRPMKTPSGGKVEETDAEVAAFNRVADGILIADEQRAKIIAQRVNRRACPFDTDHPLSPCHDDHPCMEVQKKDRDESFLIKCFWRAALTYCEKASRSKADVACTHVMHPSTKDTVLEWLNSIGIHAKKAAQPVAGSVQARSEDSKLPPAPDTSDVAALMRRHSTLRKKEALIYGRLRDWYIIHGFPQKAKDENHLHRIADKYKDHEKLLFTRLRLKYHVQDGT